MWNTFLWVTLDCRTNDPRLFVLGDVLDSYQLMKFSEQQIMFIIISVKSYSTNSIIVAFLLPSRDLWSRGFCSAMADHRPASGLVSYLKPEVARQPGLLPCSSLNAVTG